jgi:hypothetical protein
MLLIMERPGQRAERTDAEGRAVYERMLHYASTLKQRGVLRAAQSLKSTSDAVRVSNRDGRRTLTDGPFAEAKEMVGGYFLVDCASRAEAVTIAEALPAAEWATVEVREFGPCFE